MTLALPKEVQEKLARGEKVEMNVTSKALDSAFNVQGGPGGLLLRDQQVAIGFAAAERRQRERRLSRSGVA